MGGDISPLRVQQTTPPWTTGAEEKLSTVGSFHPFRELVALCSFTMVELASSFPFLNFGFLRNLIVHKALVNGLPSTRGAAHGSSTPASAAVSLDEIGGGEEEMGAGDEVGFERHPGLGVCLFCAGDEDQHIYGWRGTTVDHLYRHVRVGMLAAERNVFPEF